MKKQLVAIQHKVDALKKTKELMLTIGGTTPSEHITGSINSLDQHI